MNGDKRDFENDQVGEVTVNRGWSQTIEKWRIVVAFLAAVISFFLFTLVAFVATSWVGFQLFFVERPENTFFDVGGSLVAYGLFGLVVFIYPIFAGSRQIFKKIIESGVKNV